MVGFRDPAPHRLMENVNGDPQRCARQENRLQPAGTNVWGGEPHAPIKQPVEISINIPPKTILIADVNY